MTTEEYIVKEDLSEISYSKTRIENELHLFQTIQDSAKHFLDSELEETNYKQGDSECETENTTSSKLSPIMYLADDQQTNMEQDTFNTIVIPYTGRVGARRINTDQFQCLFCGVKMNHKSHMRMHILRHSGIKPYACSYCNYRAYEQYRIKLHTSKHHPMLLEKDTS